MLTQKINEEDIDTNLQLYWAELKFLNEKKDDILRTLQISDLHSELVENSNASTPFTIKEPQQKPPFTNNMKATVDEYIKKIVQLAKTDYSCMLLKEKQEKMNEANTLLEEFNTLLATNQIRPRMIHSAKTPYEIHFLTRVTTATLLAMTLGYNTSDFRLLNKFKECQSLPKNWHFPKDSGQKKELETHSPTYLPTFNNGESLSTPNIEMGIETSEPKKSWCAIQ